MNYNRVVLDFEKPIAELEQKLEELERYNGSESLAKERAKIKRKLKEVQTSIYAQLTTWQRVQLARHPNRPYTFDYIELMTDDFVELHGDRRFADDKAVIAGFAMLENIPIVVIGQQKGKNTNENIERNFGMPNPEGYRKALRIMQLAEKYKKPVLTLIDTPGAYPGIGAEERGQAEAIAYNLLEMMGLKVPIVSIVIGEGGSGGALGIGVGDRILMLENAVYSVISPEGCAAILWKDRSKAPEAAEVLKITSQPLKELGVIDRIVKEPPGGAHRNYQAAATYLKQAVMESFEELQGIPVEELLQKRVEKYAKIGAYKEEL